jgi:Flp pilus assembly protein CpaB
VATVSRPRTRRPAGGDTPRRPGPFGPGQGSPLRIGPPARRRQPALIVLGVALMLVAAAVAGALYLRVGNRVPVLVAGRTIEVGQQISDDDLRVVRVATDAGVQTIPATERSGVVGQFAAATLPEGALLTRAQVTPQAVPAPGTAKVGVVLQPGQVPAEELTPGDRVAVVAARSPASDAGNAADAPPPGTVLVGEARVFGQRRSEASEATVVTLIVRTADAAKVARYGAAGQVGLVVLPASGPAEVPSAAGPAAAAQQGSGG